MNELIKCNMCGEFAKYIATETNAPLCEECAKANEFIKEKDYPEKVEKFPLKKLENENGKV